jgi:DNA repair exonuclease SbcCD ATPase subunit
MEINAFKNAAFGGFNKQDVIEYIEKTAAETKTVQEELHQENDSLKEENQRLQKAVSESSDQVSLLKSQIQQQSETISGLQGEVARLQSENMELESLRRQVQELTAQAQAFQPDAESYRQFRDRIGDIECEARKRAADIESETNCRIAEAVANFREKYQNLTSSFDAASNFVTEELRKVEVNLTQLPRALDQIGTMLDELDHPESKDE